MKYFKKYDRLGRTSVVQTYWERYQQTTYGPLVAKRIKYPGQATQYTKHRFAH